jgi:inner membrane protein
MENITHTLVGAVLGKAGLEYKTPLAMPALLIAANLPDIDIFGPLFGQNNLDFHRGITHSILGVPVLSLALAAILWAGSRLATWDPARRVKFLPMLGICLLGIASNPFLDLLNDYGSRPLLPFSNHKYYGDLLSIADPWLWIIFGAAIFVIPRSTWRRIAAAVVGLLVVAVFYLTGGAILTIAWITIAGVAVAISRFLTRRGFSPARVALAVFFVYLGGLFWMRGEVLEAAWETASRVTAESVEQIDVLPGEPGSWGQWTVVIQTARVYYIAMSGMKSRTNNPLAFERYEKNLEDPLYRKSLAQNQMAVMSRFVRFPYVTIERSDSSCTVFLVDLRYARHRQEGWGTARAKVPC